MGEVTALKRTINSHSGSHPAARPQGDTNSVTLTIETALPDQDMAADGGENEGLCLRQLPPPAFRISHSPLKELPIPVTSMTEHRKNPL